MPHNFEEKIQKMKESQNHPAHSNLAGMSLAGSGVGKNVQQLVTNTAGNKTELIGNEPM